MLHLPNLRFYGEHSLQQIFDQISLEVEIYNENDFDAVMVENFHDTPFAKTRVSDTVIAKLSAILYELTNITDLSLGLNILRNASEQAMELASLYGLDFIRSNIWEGSYVTDQGIIQGVAKEVLEVRRKWGSNVEVMADIHVKHAYPLGQFSLREAAENAIQRGHADYIVVSGTGTGKATPPDSVMELNEINIKPIIGSGMHLENMEDYVGRITGAIVGSSLKREGLVSNPVDPERTAQFAEKWHNIF